jgi:hypothetical protein
VTKPDPSYGATFISKVYAANPNCTFGYVRQAGGAFARLGAMGDPDKIIGQVLSDAAIEAAVGEIDPPQIDHQLDFGAALLREAGQEFERWASGPSARNGATTRAHNGTRRE